MNRSSFSGLRDALRFAGVLVAVLVGTPRLSGEPQAQAPAEAAQEPSEFVFRRAVVLGRAAEAAREAERLWGAKSTPAREAGEIALLPAKARAEALLARLRMTHPRMDPEQKLLAPSLRIRADWFRAGVIAVAQASDRSIRWRSQGAETQPSECSTDELRELVLGYRQALVELQEERVDPIAHPADPVLREGEELLDRLSVASTADQTYVVRPGTKIPIPMPLAHAMRVRWRRIESPEQRSMASIDPELVTRLPIQRERRIAAKSGDATQPALVADLPVGDYVLECEQGPTRTAHRRVRISELDFASARWPDALVVAVRRNDRPLADAEVRLNVPEEDREIVVRTDANGLARAPMDWTKKSGRRVGIEVRSGDDFCVGSSVSYWLLSELGRPGPIQDLLHVFVDRPIYRRGERVQGRVALLRHARSEEFETQVTTLPLAGHELELIFFDSTKKQQRVRLAPTDAFGVATFSLDLADDAPHSSARLAVRRVVGDGPKIRLSSTWPFRVADFRRPPVELELELPERVFVDEVAEVRVRGTYSSGGPAFGLRGSIQATAVDLTEKREFVLDANGEAMVRVAAGELMATPTAATLRVLAKLVAPDGQTLSEAGSTALAVRDPLPPKSKLRPWVAVLAEPHAAVAGKAVVVRIKGPVGHTALVAIGRDLLRDARAITIPAAGFVDWSIDTRANDYPAVRAVIDPFRDGNRYGARSYYADQGFTLPLRRAGGPLQLAVRAPNTARPGARVQIELETRRGDRGVPASVALAVVDETVYELAADRTSSIDGLRPEIQWNRVDLTDAMDPASPWAILGGILTDGSLERFDLDSRSWASAIGLGGGAGGKLGGKAGGGAVRVRSDFRATAHFIDSVVTGPQGRASIEVELPEDLARWRLTAVAIDADARLARVQTNLQTELPLSVRSVHPRLLRVGDRIQTKALVEARGDIARAQGWSAAAEAKGGLSIAEGEDALAAVVTGVGAVAECARELRGVEVGRATLRWDARVGSAADAVEHRVPVLPDEVILTKSRSLTVRGQLSFGGAPNGNPDGWRRVLTLLGNRAAVLEEAANWLGQYPYGCVEQTLSRMMPLFVAARAAGGDGSRLSEAQALRVERGMARLRKLQHGSGAGFAWWSGSNIDRQMTAIAWTALAQARAVGIDPARYGLRIRPPVAVAEAFQARLTRTDRSRGTVAIWVDADYVVAGLRIQPSSRAHLAAVKALVQSDHSLARAEGLMARAGLALLTAGEVDLARAVLERLLDDDSDRFEPTVLGERAVVRSAHVLEFCVALAGRIEDPRLAGIRAKEAGRLLMRQDDGRFGGTYETAQALHALASDGPPAGERGVGPVFAKIRVKAFERTVLLSEANQFRAEIEVPNRGGVRVDGPKDRDVIVIARWERRVRGSTYGGENQGFEVSRSLRRAGAEGVERSTEKEIARDMLCELLVDVRAERSTSYVVVDCPLPAGFEVAHAPRGVEVRDDRIVSLLPGLRAGRPHQLRLLVRPGFEGDVAWPPVRVEAMYDPETKAATGKGSRVRIVAPRLAVPAGHVTVPLLTAEFAQRRANRLVDRIRAESSVDAIYKLVRSLRGPVLSRVRRLLDAPGPKSFHVLAPGWIASKSGREVVRKLGTHRPWAEMIAALSDGEGSARDLINFAIWRTDRRDLPELRPTYRSAVRRMLSGDAAPVSDSIHRELLFENLYDVLLDPWMQYGQSLCRTGGYRNCLADRVPEECADWIELHRLAIEQVFPLDSERARAVGDTARDAMIDRLRWPGGSVSGAAVSAVERWIQVEHEKLLASVLGRAVAEPEAIAFHRRRASVWSLLNDAQPAVRVQHGLRLWDRMAARKDSGQALVRLIRSVGSVDRSEYPAWHQQLAIGLADPDRAVRAAAFDALPDDRQRSAWPSLVLRCVDDNGQIVSLLTASRPDRAMAHSALKHWVQRTALGPGSANRVVRRVPMDELIQWPLESLMALGEATTAKRVAAQKFGAPENLRFCPRTDLGFCLATSDIPSAKLSARMASTRRGIERRLLAEVLAARGVTMVAFEESDNLGPLYSDVLASWSGDVAAARRVLQRLRKHAEAEGKRTQQAERLPGELVAPLVRASAEFMSREDLVRFSESMLDHEVAARLKANSLADLRAVLPKSSDRVIGLLSPDQLRVLRVDLIRDVRRGREARVVVDAMLAAPDGERWLLECFARPGEYFAKSAKADGTPDPETLLAEAFFEATGRRVRLIARTVGDPSEESVLQLLERYGASATNRSGSVDPLDRAERELFDGICRRRGLLVR